VARYSDEHIQTIRERMRNDMRVTIDSRIEMRYDDWVLEGMLDALVEDGMHPLEKIIADINADDLILGRNP